MPRHPTNPLRLLFRARCFGEVEGLNWLQDHGHISDLCVTVEDVAEVDVLAVLEKAKAEHLLTLPPWAKPPTRYRVPRCSICGGQVSIQKLKCELHPDAPAGKMAIVTGLAILDDQT